MVIYNSPADLVISLLTVALVALFFRMFREPPPQHPLNRCPISRKKLRNCKCRKHA